MAVRYEKETGDIVWSGFETGIAPSPHKGIANMQGVNISTELGEVMCSYARTLQSQSGTTSPTHTITAVDSSHIATSFALTNGVWINISASTISGLSTGNYYIQNLTPTSFQVSSYYNSAILTGFGSSGTATYTLLRAMGQPIASATEPYNNGTQQYRYYILDSNGLVWVQDSAVGTFWFLPDSTVATTAGATGIAILNGWLHIFVGTSIYCKPTVNLGDSTSMSTNWVAFASGSMLTTNSHFGYVGHQGKLYYTDGNFLGSIFPNTSIVTGVPNIQSYASYTASSTTGTIATMIGGSIPYDGINNTTRIPAVFFHSLTTSAANPTALTIGTIYYIKYNAPTAGHFEVYADPSVGSPLDLATGAVGTQYFATYYPTSSGGTATITFTPQRVNFPFFEQITTMTEIGNTLIIGAVGNVLYPWNQIDPTPNGLIFLPESRAFSMVTVNQMAYIFVGYKGNVYITDGSVASLVIKVPDYCAGIAGTQSSYIEPVYTWGGTMYLRGRVYFSILDQTSSKAGNCGGIWSFVPTQNLYIGQDTGLALRLENQNSYGTYSGVATVLLPSQTQNVVSPQYWAGWYSDISSPTYGIDATSATPSTSAVIEFDGTPTGTILGEQKQTFSNLEYKLAAPLASGETITGKYRLNLTDAFTTLGTFKTESATGLSGYISPLPFEKTQWVQIQLTLNPITSANSSFCRLTELRLRK